MKKSFLVGRFLSGYTSAYRYKRPNALTPPSIEPEELDRRLSRRARRLQQRRNSYLLGVQAGIVGALFVVWTFFQIPLYQGATLKLSPVEQELIVMEDIVQTRQLEKVPPPPRPVIPVLVPDEEVLEQLDLDLDASLELDAFIADLTPPALPAEEEEDNREIFAIVEEMPQIIGGVSRLMKSVKYPIVAQRSGVEGNVIVQVVVDENGTPRDPVIVRSGSEMLDRAALDAVMAQRFHPGRQRGRAVKVGMAIPVRFRLQ